MKRLKHIYKLKLKTMMAKKYFVVTNSRGEIGIEPTFTKVCEAYGIHYLSNYRKDFPQDHGNIRVHKVYPNLKIKNQ